MEDDKLRTVLRAWEALEPDPEMETPPNTWTPYAANGTTA
jgi:hypothetical protein